MKIPKLRQGSFFPALLERRRRIDQALFAVVMEAYLHGVSTRKVDDLVKALGADTGISKSEVSRICAELDLRGRRVPGPGPLAVEFPYVFLDATYCKARVKHGSSPRPSSSPSGSPPTGAAKSSGSTSATARTKPSGPRSSAP